MAHADSMGEIVPVTTAVIDFRRHSMVLQWNGLGGTWSALDVPPALVHGIALIRASQPNICIFGQGGRLHLQVGAEQFELLENSPRIRCTRGLASFGFRRHFTVESSNQGMLFNHAYWTGQGADFFRWLAARADDPEWRATNARRWSDGIDSAILRAS